MLAGLFCPARHATNEYVVIEHVSNGLLIYEVFVDTGTDSIDALRLLQEDCKDDDYETIIGSINRISTVGAAGCCCARRCLCGANSISLEQPWLWGQRALAQSC